MHVCVWWECGFRFFNHLPMVPRQASSRILWSCADLTFHRRWRRKGPVSSMWMWVMREYGYTLWPINNDSFQLYVTWISSFFYAFKKCICSTDRPWRLSIYYPCKFVNNSVVFHFHIKVFRLLFLLLWFVFSEKIGWKNTWICMYIITGQADIEQMDD